jgi:hypothetical protein
MTKFGGIHAGMSVKIGMAVKPLSLDALYHENYYWTSYTKSFPVPFPTTSLKSYSKEAIYS